MRSMAGVRSFFQRPNTGTVETGAAPGWWLVRHHVPGIRMAVIHRPVAEVIESILSIDISDIGTYDVPGLHRIMSYGGRMLKQISAQPGVLSINFADLATEDGCAAIFEFCLPYRFDREWWIEMRDKNIQVDVKAFLLRYAAMRPDVERFKALCRAELLALRRSGVALRG